MHIALAQGLTPKCNTTASRMKNESHLPAKLLATFLAAAEPSCSLVSLSSPALLPPRAPVQEALARAQGHGESAHLRAHVLHALLAHRAVEGVQAAAARAREPARPHRGLDTLFTMISFEMQR